MEGTGKSTVRRALEWLAAAVFGALIVLFVTDNYEVWSDRILGTSVTKTEVRHLNLVTYSGELNPDYEIARTVRGNCQSNSAILESNPNAYRCSSDDFGADPCLAFADGQSVACITRPSEHRLTQIDLDTPVEFHPVYDAPKDTARPWVLEVKHPQHLKETWECMSLGGATTPQSGNHPTWWCLDKDSLPAEAQNEEDIRRATALNEIEIDESGVWKILFSHPDETDLSYAEIEVAWH